MAVIARTLAGIKSDPLASLGGTDRVNELFAQAGSVSRDRLLDPATTLGLFILQVLHGNTAITHLRHLCRSAVCPASYCDARARLLLLVMASVIETLCRDCIEEKKGTGFFFGELSFAGRKRRRDSLITRGRVIATSATSLGVKKSGSSLHARRGGCGCWRLLRCCRRVGWG